MGPSVGCSVGGPEIVTYSYISGDPVGTGGVGDVGVNVGVAVPWIHIHRDWWNSLQFLSAPEFHSYIGNGFNQPTVAVAISVSHPLQFLCDIVPLL